MRYSEMTKKLIILEESKKTDIDLKDIELDYDVVKEEIIKLSKENPTLNEEQIIEMVLDEIKSSMGLNESVIEDVNTKINATCPEATFAQLIEYVKDDQSFDMVEINEKLIKEQIDIMIAENPNDSKETVAWIMKDMMKDEMVF